MTCNNCQTTNPSKSNFCGKCGKKIEKHGVNFDYNLHVKKISFFFFALLAYIAVLNFAKLGGDYKRTLIIDIIFALIILMFYFYEPKQINKLFNFKKPKKSLIIKILILAPLFAIIISFVTNLLNQNVFNNSHSTYYQNFINSPAPFLFSILSIGLFPAIFEEIAFRGIIYNELSKITSIKSSIIISSILFTILHLSLISIFWIFPSGLVFGYLRAKYRTLWYGIIGHFLYNSTIVIIEIISFSYN